MNNLSVKIAIILSTFVFYSFNAMSVNQGNVEGLVIDAETHKPVPYANVELLKMADLSLVKLVITNNDGKYQIEDIAYGKYLLRISCLSYRKEIIPEFELSPNKPVIKFATTNLFTESKTIKEIVVTGQKLTGILEDDKIIYTIKSKSAEFAQSGIELLRQLPDVTVDYISENVKLAGSSNILFQVNGRKVDHNYLTKLNPELIDKIEVITNPGTKYDSDVNGVINIILKKNMLCGLSGRIRTSSSTSSTILSKNNGSLDLFLKKVRFYVAGNYNIQRFNTETINDRFTFSPDSGTLSQRANGTTRSSKAGFSYGFDWFSNDHNTFNFYSTIRPQIPEKSEIASDNIFTSNKTNFHHKGSNTNINKNYFYDYSLFYQHKFAKKFHEISFEYYLSNKDNVKANNYYEQDYISDGMLSGQLLNKLDQVTENNNKQSLIKVDYTYPFSDNLKLSAGYNGYFLKADYSYNNLIDYTDLINYDDNKHAAYSNLSWNIGKLNFQTGARYEFSTIHITHGFDTTNHYNYLLPSVSVQYKPGKKSTFRLNYRKSVTRPEVSQLSPISYKDDPFLQSIGNPKLKPAIIDRMEFTHRIQIGESLYISYRPYISFIKNDIRLLNMATSDTVLFRKYSNVGNDFEYGITLSGTLTLMKSWSISPSWTYYRRELKALPEYGINEEMKRTSWRLNISTQYVLPKEWVLFVEYNYNAPAINYQSTTHSYYDFVAGINKAINKKFNISVFTLNPWGSRYVYDNRTTTTNNMVQNTSDAIKYNYLIFIRLGYKFNIAKVGKKLERQIETEEEKGSGKGILN
jgi:iron complex outermembrane recepter protein